MGLIINIEKDTIPNKSENDEYFAVFDEKLSFDFLYINQPIMIAANEAKKVNVAMLKLTVV